MNPISRKLSGVPIMRGCARSKRLSIQTICYSVVYALVMRAGKKLETIYAEYSSRILGQIIVIKENIWP